MTHNLPFDDTVSRVPSGVETFLICGKADVAMTLPVETRAEMAILPFRIVEDLDIPCGYERSFKLLDGKIWANRFLLGIDTRNAASRDLIEICRRMDMPETFVTAFRENLGTASMMFLGFEDNETRCIYKVYLEFFDKIQKDIKAGKQNVEPTLMHLGFKWQARNNSIRTISNYMCYPLLPIEGIAQRVLQIYGEGHNDRSFENVMGIIKFAARRSDPESFLYLEVSEDKNRRKSFDINLYPAGLNLTDIYSFVAKASSDYGVRQDQLDRLYRIDGEKALGHLSGGISRDGANFLTVYYEA